MTDKIKQIIIIRRDLKMRRGKEIAQGAHASMEFLRSRMVFEFKTSLFSGEVDRLTPEMIAWMTGEKFTKITLQVNSEKELLSIYNTAKEHGVEAHIIQDSGLTEFGGVPTYTAVAIGPTRSSEIDPITAHLKIY